MENTNSNEIEYDTYQIEYDQDKFDNMNLDDSLLRGIYAYGYEFPSTIQQKAIIPVSLGKDIIAQAQSGTGKTATFTIGTLQRINPELKELQSLVLAPTHELAHQIFHVFKSLSHYMPIKLSLIMGGSSIKDNIEELLSKPHIVIGTPGRILDLIINREILTINNLKSIVVDEADEMLSHGFKNQLKHIIEHIPKQSQICLFSATMPQEMLELTNHFIVKPLRILVKNEELTLEGIRQFYIYVDKESHKYDVLADLYNTITITQSIIYCNTRKRVEKLKQDIEQDGYNASCIHSDMKGSERHEIMKDFISGSSRLLISTDLLARGIDIQQVSVVINYDLSKYMENYIHRIGRSGRFGRKGVAINLITRNDIPRLHDLEKFYNTHIEEMPENIKELI